jgi:hypothetical protein
MQVVNIPGVDLKRGENLIDYMGPVSMRPPLGLPVCLWGQKGGYRDCALVHPPRPLVSLTSPHLCLCLRLRASMGA